MLLSSFLFLKDRCTLGKYNYENNAQLGDKQRKASL